jgi:dTDP-4-amino-4,6-dideoxygalactose transaminase
MADRLARDGLRGRLLEEFGVETRLFFEPTHRLPMYRSDDPIPNAEYVAHMELNLPTYTGLEQAHVEEIIEALTAMLSE